MQTASNMDCSAEHLNACDSNGYLGCKFSACMLSDCTVSAIALGDSVDGSNYVVS